MDPNQMVVTMSQDSKFQLIDALWDFGQHGTRCSLRDFQRIAGHLNWALNVFPLLRPGLCSLYTKTAGKLHQRALIWVNCDVECELAWVIKHLTESNGVNLLKSETWTYWSLPLSTIRVYCDATPFGLSFWFPSNIQAFQASAENLFREHNESIFYLEVLCVCAALLHILANIPRGGRIAVFTDNINMVQIFNSLATLSSFNWMLMSVVDEVLSKDVDFHVLHVPGVHNVIADLLSHFRNDEALALEPQLSIQMFQPP